MVRYLIFTCLPFFAIFWFCDHQHVYLQAIVPSGISAMLSTKVSTFWNLVSCCSTKS